MTQEVIGSKHLLKLARAFHTKKQLGQHFLVDAEVLKTITAALDLTEEDEVLEIGPGIGFLTRFLVASGAKITGVELDRESIADLKALGLKNLTIKHGDFLAYDLNSGRFREKGSEGWAEPDDSLQKKIKVVGNVPYQITGLILGHLLGEIDQQKSRTLARVDRIVLMVQKEVAERMVARPGSKNYAQLSLLVEFFCDAEIIQSVSASQFFPPPKVDSCVIRLVPLAKPRVECSNLKLLRRVIKAGFAQRRKMMRNGLTALGVKLEVIDAIYKELRFDPQLRAESLSLAQFAMLTNALDLVLKSQANADRNSSLTGKAESHI